jgi:hypothetical protein
MPPTHTQAASSPRRSPGPGPRPGSVEQRASFLPPLSTTGGTAGGPLSPGRGGALGASGARFLLKSASTVGSHPTKGGGTLGRDKKELRFHDFGGKV